MKKTAKLRAFSLSELSHFRQEIERARVVPDKSLSLDERLARLAAFPEKNPDILVETDLYGEVTYMNLVAQSRFPELNEQGFAHPLLCGMASHVRNLLASGQNYLADEVSFGDDIFERQICFAHGADTAFIRIYLHNITRYRRAEQAVQRLAKRLIYTQVEERRNLSRELHDEAGQALTALKLNLEMLRAFPPEDAATLNKYLEDAIALTEATLESVRMVAQGLRPPTLDTLGLNRTLESYCMEFAQRTQIDLKYSGCETPDLSDAKGLCLYRVLQEALTNVLKHAKARRVHVQLSCDGKQVRLDVADDGCGVDPTTIGFSRRPSGIGLLGMRERVELLGGRLEYRSAPGKGLRLAATLPLPTDKP